MITNKNSYYKSILERITHTEITGTHNDNYYIKRISETYGRTYNTLQCSNVYLRNWAEDICQTTFSGKKYNNFFLHTIAEYLTGTTYTTNNDIYFLDIILNNINYTTLTTSLTINVPISLVYTDEFNITGVLKDEENNVLSNKQVHLIVGSTIVDTQRTNSQGEVSFTTSPVSMGTHTFSLSFDGGGVYSSCTSTEVTRVIGKETSVLQLDMGTNPVFYTDSDLLADGALTTDDGEPITEKSILLVQDNTTISSAVTDSNGEFSMDLSSLSVGSAQSVSFVFSDDSYYTDSVVPVSVTIREASLSIVSDKDILSFVDGDSATLTAHYVGSEVEGKTVLFKVYKVSDDSLVETLTGDTDASGLASVSYSSKGTGDLYIRVECMSLQELYETIKDIYWYSNDGTKLTGTYTTGSDSDYNYITNLGTNVLFPSVPSGDFELSMKAYRPLTVSERGLLFEFGSSKSDTLLCGYDNGTNSSDKNVRIYVRSGNSNTSVQNNTSPNYNNGEWMDFKLRFENGTVTLTIGGTSVSTSMSSVSRIGNYARSTSRLSEMMIRTL